MFITKQYMTMINILFITAAVYLGISAFYKSLTARMDYQESYETTAPTGTDRSEINQQPLSHYSLIERRNLFKTGDQAKADAPPPPPVQTNIDMLEETRLKLKLWGTVSGDQKRAYAVIEDIQKRKQNLYRTGDLVMGATVKQILREKIVLNLNGKDEILAMEKNDSPKISMGGPSVPPNPFSRQDVPGESQRISLDRATIENAINNVNSLMSQAKIRPHFKDGKPDGLTLSRIQRDSIFNKLGLRSGDIIMGVDGQKIESVDDALKFYNSLKSSQNVNIQIQRRGQTQSIDYNIQ